MKKIQALFVASSIVLGGCSVPNQPPKLKPEILVHKTADELAYDLRTCEELASAELKHKLSMPEIVALTIWGAVLLGPLAIFATKAVTEDNNRMDWNYSDTYEDCLVKRGYKMTEITQQENEKNKENEE